MTEQGLKQNDATQKAAIRYIDRPNITETFSDSINHVHFDGQSLRLEFGITRLDEIKPNTPITGRRYPAHRVVLTPAAMMDLINRLQRVQTAQSQAVGRKPVGPPTDRPATTNDAASGTKPAKRGFWETLKKG